MQQHKGFTLIELLVVVLIIGILAAVALPQYQVTVDKAKFSTLQQLSRTIADAYRVRYMAVGTDPVDITDLDIDLPSGYKHTSFGHGDGYIDSCAAYKDFYCCTTNDRGVLVTCARTDFSFGITISGIASQNNVVSSCFSPKYNNARGIRLCKSVSKNQNPTEYVNFVTPTGYIYETTKLYSL